MTSPEALRAGRNSYVVVLHGLLRDHQKNSNQLFVLVEGKDADYYRPRLSSVFSGSRLGISYRNMRGKENEKLLIGAINRNSSLCRLKFIAFFDRDYENDISEISDRNHYVTPGYSIENLYTGVDSIREAINSLLFFDAIHDDDDTKIIDSIVANYAKLQSQYHEAVRLFNCWAWVQRHSQRTGPLDLDKFDITEKCILNFEDKVVEPRYCLADLNQLASERAAVTDQEIEQASVWFDARSPRVNFRGKQEAAFLYWFMNKVVESAASGAPPFRRRIRCSKRVSKKELLSELSNYAETPTDLSLFLNERRKSMVDASSS